jgi:aminoglycoside phosphotransferase
VSTEAPRRSATPPAAVRQLAAARPVCLAGENEHALTFEVGDGRLDTSDWAPEHLELGIEGVLAQVQNIPPADKLVVCHGDACAPNTLITDDKRWSGHVDLGDLGAADRWADLAIAAWSTGWNYGPGWEQLRRDRMSTMRQVIGGLTSASLDAHTEPVEGPGWPQPRSYPVRECLLCILNEEWEHRLYAERDLDALEARTA